MNDLLRPGGRMAEVWQRLVSWIGYPAVLLVVSLLVIVASLPLVSWLNAAAAGYRTLVAYRSGSEAGVLSVFVGGLREQWRQRLAVGSVLGAAALTAASSSWVCMQQPSAAWLGLASLNLGIALCTCGLGVGLIITSRSHTGTMRELVKAALLDATSRPARTLVCVLLLVVSVVAVAVMPLAVLAAPAVPLAFLAASSPPQTVDLEESSQ